MTDPIADFLTRIRNAQKAKLAKVVTLHSGINERIAAVLKKEKFISNFKVNTDPNQTMKKNIEVTLRYADKQVSVIQGIARLSRPGRRKYADREELERQLKTFQTTIVSTSQGVMTDRDAVKANVGGELICQVS